MERSKHDSAIDTHYRVGWTIFIPSLLALGAIYSVLTVVTLSLWGMTAYLFGAIGLCLVGIFLAKRWVSSSLKRNQEGVDLMVAGRVGEAALIFESLCTRPPNMASHLTFIFNRAVAYQCMGDFQCAGRLYRSVLDALQKRHRPFRRLPIERIRIRCAEFMAWAGQLEDAESVLETIPGSAGNAGALVVPSAILALRSGRPEAALEVIENGWAHAEADLRAVERQPLRILWAYTLHLLGRDTDPNYARALAELTAEDWDLNHWVGTQWPELSHFVHEARRPV